MKSSLLLVFGFATSLAAIPSLCRAQNQNHVEAHVSIGDPPKPYSVTDGPTTQPSPSSGYAHAQAWGSASGTGNGTATATATARTWSSDQQPLHSNPDNNLHSGSAPNTDRVAQATANTDANGRPTATAHTRGPGTDAAANADKNGLQDHAQSHNGNDPPNPLPPAPGGLGALPPLPDNNAALDQMEKMIRDNNSIPPDVKQQMLDQIRRMHQ